VPTGNAIATPMGLANVPSVTGLAKLLSTMTSVAPLLITKPVMLPVAECTVAIGIAETVIGASVDDMPVRTMCTTSSDVLHVPSRPGSR